MLLPTPTISTVSPSLVRSLTTSLTRSMYFVNCIVNFSYALVRDCVADVFFDDYRVVSGILYLVSFSSILNASTPGPPIAAPMPFELFRLQVRLQVLILRQSLLSIAILPSLFFDDCLQLRLLVCRRFRLDPVALTIRAAVRPSIGTVAITQSLGRLCGFR